MGLSVLYVGILAELYAKYQYVISIYDPLSQKHLTASLTSNLGFPGGSDGKESACNVEDWGLVAPLWLFVTPWTVAPPGSSTHEISQARILEWVAIPFSRGSSQLRDRTCVFCIARQILYCLRHQGNPIYILFFRLFSIIGYYKILTIVPCATQYIFVACCISIF